jgi:predicted alpha/beta-hydrolase family hydrolase
VPTRSTEELRIATPHGGISAVRDGPTGGPILTVAHGAGGGMRTKFIDGFAAGVAAAGVACLRFNFLYSERGRRSPDREPLLRAAWTAAFDRAGSLGDPVWVGGKSMGGRIASMMAAEGELDAAGLVFLGYPLHPPGKPDRLRDAHLDRIRGPILWLQGTEDTFARWDLLEGVVARLGDRVTLHRVDGGDHSFRVRGRPRDDPGTGAALGEVAARFILAQR